MPSWDKDDTKSRFSQYSMSSSVIKRNEGLSLLDNRFEKVLFLFLVYYNNKAFLKKMYSMKQFRYIINRLRGRQPG